MKTSIPRGMTYLTYRGKVLNDKKTIEVNNIGEEATIVMSQNIVRMIGKMK